MSVRTRSLLALAAVAALAVLATAGPAAAAPARATTTDPAVAAAGWLAQQFVDATGKPAPHGDHFDYPGGTYYWGGETASAIFALAATKTGADKIHSALDYMAAHVKADANLGSGDKPGPYDGSVATAALAAMVGGADPTSFGGYNLVQALKHDQCTMVSAPTSSTDYTTPTCPAVGAARNIFSSVSESLAILAEARGGSAPTSDAVTYFLSLQCPSGGFTGHVDACRTNTAAGVDETAYAIAALVALGGHSSELGKAVAWLTGKRSASGYWVVQGKPNTGSTGLAASALDAAGRNSSSSRAWLASQQVQTGPTVGAGASRGALKYLGTFDASSSIKATADALLGMRHGTSLATLTASGSAAGTSVLALDAPTVQNSSVRQGHSQTVTGTGFARGETVTAVVHSTPVTVGSVTTNAQGTAMVRFTVPAALAAGAHTVLLTGGTSDLSSSVTFLVRAAAATPAGPELAVTGLDGTQLLTESLLGAGLLLAGAAALMLARRRKA